jgi:hypothetical protein
MENQSFSTIILTDKSAEEVFNTILDVRGWWSGLYSEEIEGSSNKLKEEFTFRAGKGAHYSKQKLIELIPNKKIVWLVTDSKLSFLKNESEWIGTKISFEIFKQDNKTKIVFTHLGLLPEIECFDSCSNAWTQYIQEKLLRLITTGKVMSHEKESHLKYDNLINH